MAEDTNTPSAVRTVIVTKSQDEQYGFLISTDKVNKIHRLKNIIDGLPAARAGLKNDDRIMKINNESIEEKTHEEVVNMMIANQLQIELTVIEEQQETFKETNEVLAHQNSITDNPNPISVATEPKAEPEPNKIRSDSVVSPNVFFKLCLLEKENGFLNFGFGFNPKIKPKYAVFSVKEDSPAGRANLKPGDIIIEIDKVNIRKSGFEKVRELLGLAARKGQVEILAISNEGYWYFKKKKKNFSMPNLATSDNTISYRSSSALAKSNSKKVQFSEAANQAKEQTNHELKVLNFRKNTIDMTKVKPNVSIITEELKTADLDLRYFEKYNIIIERRSDYNGIGMSLSTAVNPVKRLVELDPEIEINDITLPIVQLIANNSPAEASGLQQNDIILEINGASTIGQVNWTIANMLSSSGNKIELLVGRFNYQSYNADLNDSETKPQENSDKSSESNESPVVNESDEIVKTEVVENEPEKVENKPEIINETSQEPNLDNDTQNKSKTEDEYIHEVAKNVIEEIILKAQLIVTLSDSET